MWGRGGGDKEREMSGYLEKEMRRLRGEIQDEIERAVRGSGREIRDICVSEH